MKTAMLLIFSLLISSILALSAHAGEYIVRGNSALSLNAKRTYIRAGLTVVELDDQTADSLRRSGALIERNQRVRLFGTSSPSQPWALEAVNSPAANQLPNGNGEGITVCVVDSGADVNHPALRGAIAGGSNFSGEGADNDLSDKGGHGTGVAGLIAGSRGVAPAAQLYIAKFITKDGSGTVAGAAEAIADCIGRAQVINLSFGTFEDSEVLRDVIDGAIAQGITVVAAAGNDASDLSFPARHTPVVAVGAVTKNLQIAAFSSRGPELDFVAPGVEVDVLAPHGGEATMSGTSFAAAIASGVEAIRRSRGSAGLVARDLGFPSTAQGLGLVDALLSAQSRAPAGRQTHNCFPDKKPPGILNLVPQEKVTDDEQQTITRQLSAIYAQEISAQGGQLHAFENPTMSFGAFAWRENGQFAVEMYKGTRFHKFMTKDSYTLIMCHEFGHHLGGQPIKRSSAWGTSEGGADYFGNLKCMRRYLESLPSGELFAQPAPALDLVAKCQARFQHANEVQVCARSLAASRQLGMVLADLEGADEAGFPSLDANDPRVVQTNYDAHPQAQCRVDTYRAAALCPVPWSESIRYDDVLAGSCHAQRFPEDRRPGCWFAPLAAAPST